MTSPGSTSRYCVGPDSARNLTLVPTSDQSDSGPAHGTERADRTCRPVPRPPRHRVRVRRGPCESEPCCNPPPIKPVVRHPQPHLLLFEPSASHNLSVGRIYSCIISLARYFKKILGQARGDVPYRHKCPTPPGRTGGKGWFTARSGRRGCLRPGQEEHQAQPRVIQASAPGPTDKVVPKRWVGSASGRRRRCRGAAGA